MFDLISPHWYNINFIPLLNIFPFNCKYFLENYSCIQSVYIITAWSHRIWKVFWEQSRKVFSNNKEMDPEGWNISDLIFVQHCHVTIIKKNIILSNYRLDYMRYTKSSFALFHPGKLPLEWWQPGLRVTFMKDEKNSSWKLHTWNQITSTAQLHIH